MGSAEGDTRVGVENAKGFIGDAAVGDVVQSMAPGVIQVKVKPAPTCAAAG